MAHRKERKLYRQQGMSKAEARRKARENRKPYKGAGKAKAMDSHVGEAVATGKMSPSMKEYNAHVVEELKALSSRIDDNEKFSDAHDDPDQSLNATEGIATDILAYLILNDPMLSKNTAERLSMAVAESDVEDLYPLLMEYKQLNGSVYEHIKAAGLPILAGGVLAYLDNTTTPTSSPLLRLQVILSLVAGAIFGRGAETWVASGILPLLKVLRNIFNVSQRINWRIDSANWAPPIAGGLGTLTIIGECAPELFTDQDATIALDAIVLGGFKAINASVAKTNLAKVQGGIFTLVATFLGAAGQAGALIETSRNVVGQGGLGGYVRLTVAPGHELKSTSHQTFNFEVASPTP